MAVHRLNHAVLYVRDVERTVAFYRDVFGFSQVAGQALYLDDLFSFFAIKPEILSPSNPVPFPAPIREGQTLRLPSRSPSPRSPPRASGDRLRFA